MLRQLYFQRETKLLALHQILKTITQFQRLEIKSMKEKFGPHCKIYKDKTLISVHPKKL